MRPMLPMRPTQVIVGEAGTTSTLGWLLVLKPSRMTLLHANSAGEALIMLCTLLLQAGENRATLSACSTCSPCRRSRAPG